MAKAMPFCHAGAFVFPGIAIYLTSVMARVSIFEPVVSR